MDKSNFDPHEKVCSMWIIVYIVLKTFYLAIDNILDII